ncbi:MAG: SufE family protein [Chlamydiota bacterium]
MDLPIQTPDLLTLYQKKHRDLLTLFSSCKTLESIYEKIITLGKTLPKPAEKLLEEKTEDHVVKGCQSVVLIFSQIDSEGKMFYHIDSDALISSGLASLLLFMYQGESAEFILFCPPLFIGELKLNITLSPGRSNGLASMYSRMKQDALKLFLKSSNPSL